MTTEVIDILVKLGSLVLPLLGGFIWITKRIDKGNAQVLKKITKIDKHKVSYKECDKRRAECPCRPPNVATR